MSVLPIIASPSLGTWARVTGGRHVALSVDVKEGEASVFLDGDLVTSCKLPPPRWIPVFERLPEPEQCVIFVASFGEAWAGSMDENHHTATSGGARAVSLPEVARVPSLATRRLQRSAKDRLSPEIRLAHQLAAILDLKPDHAFRLETYASSLVVEPPPVTPPALALKAVDVEAPAIFYGYLAPNEVQAR